MVTHTPSSDGDVGAQAAEIAAPARAGRRRGSSAGLQDGELGVALHADLRRRRASDIGSPHDRVQKSVPSSWLAGKQVIGWPLRRCRSAGSRAAVSHSNTRASNAASSTEQPARAAAQHARGERSRERARRARGHLIMLLTNGRVGRVGRQLEILLVVVVGLARASGAHVALAQELVRRAAISAAMRFASSPRAQASPTSPWPSSFSRLGQHLAHAARRRRRARRAPRRRGRRGRAGFAARPRPARRWRREGGGGGAAAGARDR